MSCRHDNANWPWLFVRDELDVLEDEYGEIFRRHKAKGDRARHAIEDSVIGEQQEAEAYGEQEMERLFGYEWREEIDRPVAGEPIKEILRRETFRDPLYARAFRWARELFHWSGGVYYRQGECSPDLFRVHINACLVPVKISFAQCEEFCDNEHCLTFAEKEYRLAGAYLERSRESLRVLRLLGYLPDSLRWTLDEGASLGEDIRRRRERVAERKRSRRL